MGIKLFKHIKYLKSAGEVLLLLSAFFHIKKVSLYVSKISHKQE